MNISTQKAKTAEEIGSLVEEALKQGKRLRRKKQYKQGIDLLVEALQYGVNKEMIYYRLGNLYIDAGDLGRAEYAYKRALDVDPQHVNAMHNLAIVYKQQKKVSQFVKTYKRAQRMELHHPRKANLSSGQKTQLRHTARRIFMWFIIGVGVLALILWLLLR